MAAKPYDDSARAYLQSLVSAGTNPAVSAAIYADGRVRFISAGTANAQLGVAADEHTIYRIGSITKAFTGTILQELMRQHLMVAATPIDRYLRAPVNSVSFRQPTVEELLQMRGGVPHGWYYSQRADLDAEAIDERFAAVTEPPGQSFTYSNFSYGLLAAAASHVAHLGYGEMFEKYLFSPLSMADSFVSPAGIAPQRLATPYASNATPAINVYLYPAGGAGALSSAADLLSFALYNMGVKRARSPLSDTDAANVHSPKSFYANGWGQAHLKDGGLLWVTDGESLGGCATVLALPQQKIAVAVLTNVCHTGQTDTIAAQLLGTLAPDLASEVTAIFRGGGVDTRGTPAPRATAGRFDGYANIDGRQITLEFTINQDGTATCALAHWAGSPSNVTPSETGESFSCSGPPELQKLSEDFGDIAARPVRWLASVRIESTRAYGELRVQNEDTLPGFRLSFPVVANHVTAH